MKGNTSKKDLASEKNGQPIQKPLYQIKADHRENPSGIPHLLHQKGVEVRTMTLKTGDYIINNEIITASNFCMDYLKQVLYWQTTSWSILVA